MNVWYNGDTVYLWKILSGYIELDLKSLLQSRDDQWSSWGTSYSCDVHSETRWHTYHQFTTIRRTSTVCFEIPHNHRMAI